MRKAIITLCLIIGLAGCVDSSVSVVKDGTIAGYEGTTVGQAFEGTFTSPKWESTTSGKGYTTVCFTGVISQQTHSAFISKYIRSYDFVNNAMMSGGADLARKVDRKIIFMQRALQQCYGEDVLKEKILPLLDFWREARTEEERNARYKAYLSEILDSYFVMLSTEYWPTGEPVQFCWTLSKDKKNFEIESFSSPSWAKFRMTYNQVLQTIYTQ